ncbi:hypothetical protein FRC06_006091 [Ceratobasidium sp. 370]|nr:hypothetical protein FRC06_006091 [Ceratobasidium sp. 370]
MSMASLLPPADPLSVARLPYAGARRTTSRLVSASPTPTPTPNTPLDHVADRADAAGAPPLAGVYLGAKSAPSTSVTTTINIVYNSI